MSVVVVHGQNGAEPVAVDVLHLSEILHVVSDQLMFVLVESFFLPSRSCDEIRIVLDGKIENYDATVKRNLQRVYEYAKINFEQILESGKDAHALSPHVMTFQRTYGQRGLGLNEVYRWPFKFEACGEHSTDFIQVRVYGIEAIVPLALDTQVISYDGCAVVCIRQHKSSCEWQANQVYALRVGFFMPIPGEHGSLWSRVRKPFFTVFDITCYSASNGRAKALEKQGVKHGSNCGYLWIQMPFSEGLGPVVKGLKEGVPRKDIAAQFNHTLDHSTIWVVVPSRWKLRRRIGSDPFEYKGRAKFILFTGRLDNLPFHVYGWRAKNARSTADQRFVTVRETDPIDALLQKRHLYGASLYRMLLTCFGPASFSYAVTGSLSVAVVTYLVVLATWGFLLWIRNYLNPWGWPGDYID